MDNVIYLQGRRRARGHPAGGNARRSATFYFDLAEPETYLAAERVERSFVDARWAPVIGDVVLRAVPAAEDADLERARGVAAARAQALRIPLVWPDRMPVCFRAAMRVAACAAESGRAAAFVLAASRLAFCGGFDLDDPDILAEASAAAGVPLEDALRAAGDRSRDAAMETQARHLHSQGADRLPVIAVGRTLFCGEERLAEAAAAARAPQTARRAAWPQGSPAG